MAVGVRSDSVTDLWDVGQVGTKTFCPIPPPPLNSDIPEGIKLMVCDFINSPRIFTFIRFTLIFTVLLYMLD